MDPRRFDSLVHVLSTDASRRRALAALLAGFVAPLLRGQAAAASRGKRKTKGKDRAKNTKTRKPNETTRAEALSASCCSGGACTPGTGKNLGKCCFENQNLAGKNFRGANLGNAIFRGATLTNANFTSANLDRTCFVEANLTGANFSGVNLGAAIFCRTLTSQGINNTGCNKGTKCCETGNKAVGDSCASPGDVCAQQGVCQGGVCACRRGTHLENGQCVVCDVCPSGCRFSSVPAATAAASSGSTIRICPGTYPGLSKIVDKDLTIVGAGADQTILDGQNAGAFVLDFNATTSTVRALTVTRGRSSQGSEWGGGVRVAASPGGAAVTLEDVHLRGNRTGAGGGIAVSGFALLRRCRIEDNSAINDGGGIFIFEDSTAKLDNCVVAGNNAERGGGIFNRSGTLQITNSTEVTDNVASNGVGAGGGVNNGDAGNFTLSGGSSVTGNTPDNCVGTAAC